VAASISPLAPGELRVVLAGGPEGALREAATRVDSLLLPEERARAARFRREVDAWCHVAGRGLLRHLVGVLAGVDSQRLRIGSGPHGKPTLPDHPALHVNIAHSGGLVAVAVTRLGPVGVDVERVEEDRATPEIARRFFAPEEEALLGGIPPGTWTTAFFETWTRKEAFLKATGLGISRGLGSFAVTVGEPARLRRVDGGPPPERWWMADVAVPEGYRGAVAVERTEPAPGPPVLRVVRWP
jgi:4'-phosphopantetheinyl transferase